jgi:hypothetical protein
MRPAIAVLVGLGGVTACSTGPDQPDTVEYYLSMNASISDTTPERIRTFNCAVSGPFQLLNPAPASGTVTFPVNVIRSVEEQSGQHFESTRADTSYSEAVLSYTGIGGDSLNFTLGAGAYTVSPDAGELLAQEAAYAGSWICGPDFPLAQDSALGAYGFDPALEFEGVWEIQQMIPIG